MSVHLADLEHDVRTRCCGRLVDQLDLERDRVTWLQRDDVDCPGPEHLEPLPGHPAGCSCGACSHPDRLDLERTTAQLRVDLVTGRDVEPSPAVPGLLAQLARAAVRRP